MGSSPWRRWWDSTTAGFRGPRTTGFPSSSNGASSFHLRWQFDGAGLGGDPVQRASVVLEVVAPPQVERLYFWAMQVDVADPVGRRAGGAHLGLQWHPGHPGSTAVNWGGYDQDGVVLHGSTSELPSALQNPHTRDHDWRPSTPYRLTVERAPADDQPGEERKGSVSTAWRGSITDQVTGECTVVRDLYAWGDRIVGVIMWSEVFARCDDPQTAVRWSDAAVTTAAGRTVRPVAFGVNYQSDGDGGCANTTSVPDAGFRRDGESPEAGAADRTAGLAIMQVTHAERTTAQGDVIRNL
ncbi:MAG: hypothetical protein ACYC2O_11050 [Microthrixaceae bacterium]